MARAGEDQRTRWALRTVPTDLATRYRAEGWWTDTSLGVMVEDGLRTLADAPFRVHSQVHPYTGTFADLDRAARAFAGTLAAQGVGPGSVVVSQLPNWVEAAVTFFASAYLGAVVVPIVHFYGAKEVDYILRVTEPDVVVTPDRFGRADHLAMYAQLLADRPAVSWFVAGDTAASALPAGAAPFGSALEGNPLRGPLPVDPDAPAVVAFTSGTTRDPKGVVHSHNTMGFEARQLDYFFPHAGLPQLVGAPVGHFIGMLNAFVVSLLRSDAVHLLDVWDPGVVLRLMQDEGVAMTGGATYFLTSVLDHPDFTEEHLRYMPFAGLGGSVVPAAVTERATRLGIRTYRSYGSTEHPSITASLITDPEPKRLLTDGCALPGVDLHLEDDGEILSRGPDLFLGYTDPELTASVFDDDGWYHTGDIGVLDDDGYLAITDRISDVIIRAGENISALEVEEQLLGLDAVAEVAVVSEPDDRLGERAAAVIRLYDGRTAPTLDDVREHLAGVGLARQKWPESIHVVAEFPRTPSGKVQKFKLRRALRDGDLGGTR